MATKDRSESAADRRALREALTSADELAPTAPTAGTRAGGRDDEAIIEHITALGSYLTTRMEAVDHRLDELADLLESLLSSLLELLLATLPDADDAGRHATGDDPVPATGNQRASADPR